MELKPRAFYGRTILVPWKCFEFKVRILEIQKEVNERLIELNKEPKAAETRSQIDFLVFFQNKLDWDFEQFCALEAANEKLINLIESKEED